MEIILKTERLEVRPIHIMDAGFIYQLVNTEEWKKFIGERNINNLLDAMDFITSICNDPNRSYHVFEINKSRVPIGIITFLKREDEKYPDFGFAMLPEFQKKGYAIEACESFLEKIKTLHQYKNIIAIVKPANERSIHLLNKLGFSFISNHNKNGELLAYYRLKEISENNESN
ncbi:GNAT family N-acetyltransferase [Flagellimonas crocea]|uniref:GNAT family N-acetyltransferase n=1 Tax=Flagellimonas crocea TaxID=3067311 RepID=UPI00296FC999|nr:GNAT family N-acetyltransferase [Muricauda sp. DH64]